MSDRNLDPKGRWRCVTIAFRVSSEEGREIDRLVRLSGLTKQEYLSRRCREVDVVIRGNPKVYKALKTEMQQILEELSRLETGQTVDDELRETIRLVAIITDGMRNNAHEQTSPSQSEHS